MPGGGFGGPPPGGFGGPGGPGFPGSVSGDFASLIQARADLRTALNDPKASPDAVREKVAAVRQARKKARAALADAAKSLLELLTADQEAVLVALGHLD
jgi:Spy/CpxP family protein refolding chaperone